MLSATRAKICKKTRLQKPLEPGMQEIIYQLAPSLFLESTAVTTMPEESDSWEER